MIVHKDQIVFREAALQTEQGRMLQTRNEKWKKLKIDIEKNGIINPLICTEKNGKYRLCMGMRRFIAGCLLGIKNYKIEIVPDEEVDTLVNATKKYQTKHKDGTDVSK
jgi:ParB-like chromosome segregation protein Spo0J